MSIRIIEIVPYNPAWPETFEKEAKLLHQTLGGVAKKIHHIGSTAVPGLGAKPIIDILIEVSSLEQLDALNGTMESIGYEPKGELGISRRRYFQKGGLDRTHQIHAFQSGDSHVVRHLAFRDYLRDNPETAREYEQLKTAVAKTCGNDLGRYCDGKDEFVKRLEAKALQSYKQVQPLSHSTTMTFRFATPDDCPLLAGLNHQLIRDEGHRNQMTVPELEQRMRGWLSSEYRAVIFEDGGDVVAYGLYREQAEEIYLRQLFVVRNRRRQGIGRRVIEILRTKVWPTGKRLTVDVLVANQGGVAFWRSVGYSDYALSLEILSGQ